MDAKTTEFANKKSFTIEKKFIHGIMDDVYVTITPTSGMLNIYLSMSCPVAKAEDEIKQVFKQYKGISAPNVTQKGESITIIVNRTKKLMEYETLDALISSSITAAKEANAVPNVHCVNCGKETDDIAIFKDVCCPVCSGCTSVIEMENRTYTASPITYLTGIIGALLGALICAIPWIVIYHNGWILSILSALIALGAYQGYKLFKGPRKRGYALFTIYTVSILTAASSFFIYVYVYASYVFETLLTFDDFKFILSRYFSSEGEIRSLLIAFAFSIMGIIGIHKQIGDYTLPSNARVLGKRQGSLQIGTTEVPAL
ncbi:MAG: hypothetical protein FWG88_02060 [Oscillospiraceae bacterium]|nr:hypothetical protein [Oscillospiraceae bacterium]